MDADEIQDKDCVGLIMNKITINNFTPSKIAKIDVNCKYCGGRFQIENSDALITTKTINSKCKAECCCPYCGLTCIAEFDGE